MGKTPHAGRVLERPHRIECGACSLLRQPYRDQLERKRRWLMETFAKKVRYEPHQLQRVPLIMT